MVKYCLYKKNQTVTLTAKHKAWKTWQLFIFILNTLCVTLSSQHKDIIPVKLIHRKYYLHYYLMKLNPWRTGSMNQAASWKSTETQIQFIWILKARGYSQPWNKLWPDHGEQQHYPNSMMSCDVLFPEAPEREHCTQNPENITEREINTNKVMFIYYTCKCVLVYLTGNSIAETSRY